MKRNLILVTLFLALFAHLAASGQRADGSSTAPTSLSAADSLVALAPEPEVDFTGVVTVPAQFHTPIRLALAAAPPQFDRAGRLTVSVMERYERFAHLVLVPTAVVESGWELPLLDHEIVDIFARQDEDGRWQAYVLDERSLPLLRQLMPSGVFDFSRTPAAGNFLFPWSGGNWWLKLGYPGWHGNNAVDFKPTDSADRNVLAAEAGTLTQVCNDGYQSILRVDHGESTTRYLHLDANTIPADRLNQSVARGELLGQLYDGHVFDGGYCADFPELQYDTRCGCGTIMHLHFESSDTGIAIDGYNYDDVAYSSMGTPYLSHNGSGFSPYPDARFISQSGVETTMVAGKTYEVSLTFQNVGSETWTDAYRLGSQNPANNATWGRARVYPPAGETVAPGESKRFDFTIAAPAIPGSYDFQWRLLGADDEWLGAASPNVRIEVEHATPRGYLEAPLPGELAGVVPLLGWAAADGSSVDPVEVWVDERRVGEAAYGTVRPDEGGNYGFHWKWDTATLAPGPHTIQVRAVSATGHSAWLPLASGDTGPLVVTVQALPGGYVDTPAPDAVLSGTVRIAGWSAVAGSTISRVEVYVDDRFRGNAIYGTARPDAGGNYGFYWDWDTGDAGNGPHTIRVRAVSSSGTVRWLPSSTAPGPSLLSVTVSSGSRSGDADGDGRADGVDYVIWLNHRDRSTENGVADGDFNEDGQVDDLDYVIWLENYDR